MRALILPVLTGLALSATPPAQADTPRALDSVLLPGFADFAAATQRLAQAAEADCAGPALRPAYDAAWDAWSHVGFVGIGPSATANITIAFWPDTRGATTRAVQAALAGDTPDTAAEVAGSGAALRGLTALDAVLGRPQDGEDEAARTAACRLVRAISADLAAQAAALARDWTDFAQVLRSAGSPGNATYLSPQEATAALFTQILAGIEFAADQRLGRPLGEPGRPRPARAEAWRTGRPVPNLLAALDGLQDLALALSDAPLPRTLEAFASARAAIEALADPSMQDLADPQAALRAEIARQRVEALREVLATELGPALGVAAGFNALDGD